MLDLPYRRFRQLVRTIERRRYDDAIHTAQLTEQAVLRATMQANSPKPLKLPPWLTWDDAVASEEAATHGRAERARHLPWKRHNLPPDLLAYLERHGHEA